MCVIHMFKRPSFLLYLLVGILFKEEFFLLLQLFILVLSNLLSIHSFVFFLIYNIVHLFFLLYWSNIARILCILLDFSKNQLFDLLTALGLVALEADNLWLSDNGAGQLKANP